MILFILSTLCVVVPLYFARQLGSIRLVSPLHLLAYMSFFGVFLKTVYMQVFDGVMFFDRYGATDEDVLSGYLYITLFVIMICLGYLFSVRRNWKVDTGETTRAAVAKIRSPYILALASLIVAALVVGNMLAVRGLGGISSAFNLATIDALNSSKIVRIEGVEGFGASFTAVRIFLFLPTLAFTVFLARYTIWRSPRDLMLMVVFLGLEFFLTVLEGKRFGLVLILANVAAVSVLLGRRVSVGTFARGAMAIVLVAGLFVMMSTFRANRSMTEDVRFDAWPAIEQILSSTYFLDINVPILILKLADEDDQFWGLSYTYWTFAWIPRQFWPTKPAVTLGPYVKQEVLGLTGTIGGINPTGPGEAYLNFGWFGILVGLALGGLFRFVEVATLSVNGLLRRGGVWVYPIVVFPLIFGTLQSSFSGTLISCFVVYLLLRVSLLLLERKVRFSSKRKSPAYTGPIVDLGSSR